LREDQHYLASSVAYGDGGDPALESALKLFLEKPELGFVWLAYHDDMAVAVCVVSLAISTSAGALVAKLDDVYVAQSRQRAGVGTVMLARLKDELRNRDVRRIDTSVHSGNDAARRFYEKHNFLSLHEERLACPLT
jgi:GNAT superfamily N-acetyltransferase